MSDSRVTHRYVKSLLGLAVEKGALDEVHADMQVVDQLCQASREFVMMLRSPIIPHFKKRLVFEMALKGKLHPLSYSIIEMITRKNREPLLPSIAAYFHEAYNDYNKIGSARVTTVTRLDTSLKQEINALVKKLSGRESIELEEKTDGELIGGFVLDVGDTRIDASVKNKLQGLQRKFRS